MARTWRTAVLDALRDGLFVVDSDGTVIEVNEGFHTILGYGPAELPYRRPHPWWPAPEQDPQTYAEITTALDGMQGTPGQVWRLRLRHRDGRTVQVEVSVGQVEDPELPEHRWVGLIRDVTAREGRARRDRLLAEVALLVALPGDLADRVDRCTQAAAEAFGRPIVVMSSVPDGRVAPQWAAWPGAPELARALVAPGPVNLVASLAGETAAGRAFALPRLPDAAVSEMFGGDAARMAAFRSIGMGATLVAPLIMSGRLVGLLVVVSDDDDPNFDAVELELAEALAAALAGFLEADRTATREHQLHDAAAALAAASSVREASAALSAAVQDALGATGVLVVTVHPDDPDHLRLEHKLGLPDSFTDRLLKAPIDNLHATAEVLRSGEPMWLHDEAVWRERYPHIAEIEGYLGTRAWMALPLRHGSRTFGVVAASFGTERAFPPDERAFAMNLVGQAALAFERAALADAHWEIARTLQHSLLPQTLPEHPRLGLATHYQSAGRHNQAGGDWYDVVELDDGRVGIVVGDVVGHGAPAAAIMGQLRSTLTGYLLENHRPGAAIRLLSRAAARIDGAFASTAVCLLLDPATGELTWASAGHPPPLLLDPAASPPARLLTEAGGPGLGIGRNVPHDYEEAELTLAVGASVVLYTDGLVERPGENLRSGLDRLLRAAARHLDAGPRALLHAVLGDTLGAQVPEDDVALVVARRTAERAARRPGDAPAPLPEPALGFRFEPPPEPSPGSLPGSLSEPSPASLPGSLCEPSPAPLPEPVAESLLEPAPGVDVEHHHDGSRTVRLSGAIDLDTVGRLREAIHAAVVGCSAAVTIDTGRLTYVGSVGVRLLAETLELGDGRVRLAVPPGSVTETHLAVSGFTPPS